MNSHTLTVAYGGRCSVSAAILTIRGGRDGAQPSTAVTGAVRRSAACVLP